MTAGTRRLRNPPGAGAEIAASAATLAYNVAISQVTSGIGYVMANTGAAALSVIAARYCGVSWADLGMCPDRLGRGIRIGLITALPAAAVVGLGAMVPATRGFFQDERARGGGARHVLFETLVRIPLGTALPEEVIFRGSLLGLFTQRHSPATAAWMTSILFGVCHVLPTLRTLPMNPAGARVRGNLEAHRRRSPGRGHRHHPGRVRAGLASLPVRQPRRAGGCARIPERDRLPRRQVRRPCGVLTARPSHAASMIRFSFGTKRQLRGIQLNGAPVRRSRIMTPCVTWY